jgi:unconventional prefoldin RPB5 interactor 1
MTASTQAALEGIESRRAQLQESVDKLRKALTHWTTCEAEYQELTSEIAKVPDASPAQMREMAHGLGSTQLDPKEVEALLGKDDRSTRSANQVVDMISRRIDYVQQNSATVEKQLDAAEKQLAGVDVLLEPGVENEEGLPMMDIEEELDEHGNEIASSINQTGKAAAEVIEVLRKAGLQRAQLADRQPSTQAQDAPLNTTTSSTLTAAPAALLEDESETAAKVQMQPNPRPHGVEGAQPTKKSVSFAEDTKSEASKGGSTLERDGYNDSLADMNFTRGTKVIELDQDDNEIASYPIIPQGESPEDAELRRQMLQYGLSEVGQIVAELNLDHPTAEFSDEEDDFDAETDDDEDEDEYGRSLKPAVTDDYRQQMLELEKKLNARMMENVGPQGSSDSLAGHVDDVRTLRIRQDELFDQSLETEESKSGAGEPKKKGVRFADTLDVSEAPQPTRQPAVQPGPRTKPPATISDTIIERPTPKPDAMDARPGPSKASRFKTGRLGPNEMVHALPTPDIPPTPAIPTGPAGRTLSNTVVEHHSPSTKPSAPDEFDPLVMNREIQTEYHKARNRFIQQQGGFKATQEGEESPVVEGQDGKSKKVSRFMAARLKGSGV